MRTQEDIRAYYQEYYRKNKERINATTLEWQHKNKERNAYLQGERWKKRNAKRMAERAQEVADAIDLAVNGIFHRKHNGESYAMYKDVDLAMAKAYEIAGIQSLTY